MDSIWTKMYQSVKSALNERQLSEYVSCGEVSAAILSGSGKIYTGVCIDTCSTLGICAERNAIFNMITNVTIYIHYQKITADAVHIKEEWTSVCGFYYILKKTNF
ncbi:MAG: hypothetical protein NC093_07670 [Alistipes sp.]|nr:hypothetical protein [Alistipes sp.]